MRHALFACALAAAAALSGCATKGGDGDAAAGDWSVTTSAEKTLWLWMDGDIPTDEEYFSIDATPSAFPEGDFEAGIDVRVQVTMEADSADTAAVPTGALTLSLLRDEVEVASERAEEASGEVIWDILLTDTEGLSGCDGSGPCTLIYTITGTLDGQDALAIGDAELSAWITGSGAPPDDAELRFSFF